MEKGRGSHYRFCAFVLVSVHKPNMKVFEIASSIDLSLFINKRFMLGEMT